MAPATAQISVSVGETTQFSVSDVPGDTYTWELYNDVTGLNLATTPGNCPATDASFSGGINTGATVNVTWHTPGTYFYKVTASRGGCTSNLKLGTVIVTQSLPTASIGQPPPICAGDTATLEITLNGQAPWRIVIYDGTTSITYDNILSSPFLLPVSPQVSTTYQITEISDVNGTNTLPSQPVQLIVKPRPVSSHIYPY